MRIHPRTWLVIGLLELVCTQATAAERRLVLVRDGKAASSIVVDKAATRAAQLAAAELQWHVREITGATVPILTDADKARGVRILVGESEATRTLGLRAGDFGEQEYLVRFMPNTLVLMGRDKPDTDRIATDPARAGRYQTWPGLYDERGTLTAAYDFLERCCNVRWLNPTDTGTHCPKQTTLAVAGGEVRRRPHFSFRDVLGARGGAPERYDEYISLWRQRTDAFKAWEAAAYAELRKRFPKPGPYRMARRDRVRLFQLRMREGGQLCRCNHSMYGFYDRFWEKNPRNPKVFVRREPDWFAKGYENRPPQMCYTSPGLVRQLAQDARDYLDGRKTGADLSIFWRPTLPNPFPIEPMDNSSFCKCDRCQAWLAKRLGDVPLYSRGAHSEYFFQFVNAVAREVRKTHPQGRLVTLAYMTHAYPPESFKLEPNVAVQFCFASNRAPYNRKSYEHELGLLRRWAEVDRSRPLYLWLYYTFPKEIANNGKFHCFPGFFAHTIAEQFGVFKECGVRGMFHCGYGQEVEAYVTYKLMDDPTLDVDVLLDDYFSRLYGPAGEPLKRMYLEIERIYSDPANYPKRAGHQSMAIAWGRLGTPERMARLGGFMAEARKRAATDVHRKNVDLFDKAVWSYMQAGRKQFEDRLSTPIPSVVVPRVADAGGDAARVDWSRAGALGGSWYDRGQSKPAARRLAGRVAHDGGRLYVELTDPVDPGKLEAAGTVFPYDTWELFVASQRALPYRQYAVGPTGLMKWLSHGEVNWRRNVVMEGLGVKATRVASIKDKWVTRLAFPLAKVVPGGVEPGGSLYLNVIRVSNPKLAGKGARLGIDSWVSFCTVHEVDRLAELKLEK